MLTTASGDLSALCDEAEDRWRRATALCPPRENLDRPLDDEFHIPAFQPGLRAFPPPCARTAGRLPPRPPRALFRPLSVGLRIATFVVAVAYLALQMLLLAVAVGVFPFLLLLLGSAS